MSPNTLTVALWLATAAFSILCAAIGLMVRVVLTAARRVERFDVALFGEKGDNGINGRLKSVEAAIEEHHHEALRWRHRHNGLHQELALDLERLRLSRPAA